MSLSTIRLWALLIYIASIAVVLVTTSQVCSPAGIPLPELLGIEITSISAYERHNYSTDLLYGRTVTGPSFYNISISYTHPGTNDAINVQVWLPLEEWNLCFKAQAGVGMPWATLWL
jgi:hypothetical protein